MKDRWFLYLMTIGMEGCWFFAILSLLNRQVAQYRLSVTGFLLLLPVAFAFNRLLDRRRLPEILRNIISWAMGVGAMLVMLKLQLYADSAWSDSAWFRSIPQAFAELLHGFRPELLVLLGSGILWWLGRRLARLNLSFTMMVAEFQFGLVILLGIFFISAQLDVNIAGSVPAILLFFLFALLGISVAHAREGTSWLSGIHRHQWATLLLASIGIIILLGWLINWLINPDFLQVILDGLKWLWGLVIRLLEFLASLLPEPGAGDLPSPSPMPGLGPVPEERGVFQLPETLSAVLRIGWVVLMVGVLVFALWRISSQVVAWLRRRMGGVSAVEMEPIRGAFRLDILNLLKWLMTGLARLFTLRFSRKAGETSPEIASVRQVYRQFLRWAAGRGYARGLSQTPHEYLAMLAGFLPELEPELAFITNQYIKVRYSPTPLVKHELNQLRESWHNIKKSKKLKRRGNG